MVQHHVALEEPEGLEDSRPWGFDSFDSYVESGRRRFDEATVEEREWFRKAAKILLGIDS